MPEMIVRKCTACKESIEISRSDISNVIYYDKVYYHKACFCERAEKRSQSKCKKQKEWQSALDGIAELETETKQMLESALAKDDLNEWLLGNYDIAAVPSRFWQIVADLERGVYKGKKCKPVTMETLFEVWKWGQKKLNEIAAKNKTNHGGPHNDIDRLRYDLAILIDKFPLYLKKKAKAGENESRIKEAKEKAEKASAFNYEELSKQAVSNAQEESNDILDLMNEIF